MNSLPTQFSTLLEAGTDEAGRGCLAGPVTAAAVILPPDFSHPLLNDSKKMTDKKGGAKTPPFYLFKIVIFSVRPRCQYRQI